MLTYTRYIGGSWSGGNIHQNVLTSKHADYLTSYSWKEYKWFAFLITFALRVNYTDELETMMNDAIRLYEAGTRHLIAADLLDDGGFSDIAEFVRNIGKVNTRLFMNVDHGFEITPLNIDEMKALDRRFVFHPESHLSVSSYNPTSITRQGTTT